MQRELIGDNFDERKLEHILSPAITKQAYISRKRRWVIDRVFVWKNYSQDCQPRNATGDLRWLFRRKKAKRILTKHTLSPSITRQD